MAVALTRATALQPMTGVPSAKKLTLPVAALLLMVAVNVTGLRTMTELAELTNIVVLAGGKMVNVCVTGAAAI